MVDDDENIRSALRRLFGPQGYRVLMAEEGHAALGVIETESIDVLITDMRMPGMDGSELLRRVTRRWPRMVRILLTGYADLQLTTQAIRDGYVDHFLTKPWE
ncbi:MAG: response regulator, partial [Sandaracinaceae bacterium]|nr:response regulator [Sandaracinaceae bacterium]